MLNDNAQLLTRLDMQASELASGQEKDSFSAQLVPNTTLNQLKNTFISIK